MSASKIVETSSNRPDYMSRLDELLDRFQDAAVDAADPLTMRRTYHQSERRQARAEIEALFAAHEGLKEALRRADHTLSLHGKIDGNTGLHEFIRAALAAAE